MKDFLIEKAKYFGGFGQYIVRDDTDEKMHICGSFDEMMREAHNTFDLTHHDLTLLLYNPNTERVEAEQEFSRDGKLNMEVAYAKEFFNKRTLSNVWKWTLVKVVRTETVYNSATEE